MWAFDEVAEIVRERQVNRDGKALKRGSVDFLPCVALKQEPEQRCFVQIIELVQNKHQDRSGVRCLGIIFKSLTHPVSLRLWNFIDSFNKQTQATLDESISYRVECLENLEHRSDDGHRRKQFVSHGNVGDYLA